MKNDIWATTASSELDEPELRSPLLDAKVMMVDDEPLMTDLIQTHLEDAGYVNFVMTNDPRDALAMLRREDPGVLLLDLMMPQVSGFELLEAIRADRALRYVPVIVLTASTGADSKLRALQLGATDFLSKPVDASELVLRVRNTLAFRQYHDRLINFDTATGLPNQRMFDRSLVEMLARSGAVGGLLALLSVTVPEWRQLRESIGQEVAEGLAKAIARRLERFAAGEGSQAFGLSVERAPRVARLGSDRFGMLLEGLADADAVEATVRRLLAVLCEPVTLGLHEVAPSPWIGISVAPADGHTVEALHKCADLAGTQARGDGTTHFKFASPEMNAKSYARMTLGLQLRGAAQRGELRLHYQPKLDLASNRIVGAEALVRWEHPEHGLLAPARFIPLAEELGLIGSIGQWVIEHACVEAAGWARAGLGELKIAVNVAKQQFTSGDLAAVLRQAMLDSGVRARQLVLELTESMLMDDLQDGLDAMRELKALGVTLSIDDFGTGYSSLSYLKRLPIDELKIDRSFVVDLPGRNADAAIVQAVIDLGHSLDMSVIAEGVETAAQLDCLRQLGCDQYQGFLYSKALPADRFTELLSREPSLSDQPG
jgi:predicted signal transduction protein with EAL and GGDEF domain